MGQGIALFCEIVRRHQLYEHYDYMRIAVAGLNKSMLRFLQKRSRHGLIHHTSRVLLRKPL